jgi:hypothetical protein
LESSGLDNPIFVLFDKWLELLAKWFNWQEKCLIMDGEGKIGEGANFFEASKYMVKNEKK